MVYQTFINSHKLGINALLLYKGEIMQKFHHELDYEIKKVEFTRQEQSTDLGNGITRVAISININGQEKEFWGMSRCSKKRQF